MASNNIPTVAVPDSVWLDANRFYDAERRYEIIAKETHKRPNPGVGRSDVRDESKPVHEFIQSTVISELALARKKIKKYLDAGEYYTSENSSNSIFNRIEKMEKEQILMKEKIDNLQATLDETTNIIKCMEGAINAIKSQCFKVPETETVSIAIQNGSAPNDADDDLDLFGSDEENEEELKLKEERLQAYANKKSKKPALTAKSSIVLDVKPWDDETDMNAMESAVRQIETEGLVWGASQLVPLAFGIKKLQIVAIVEDEKVSIDWLQETISNNEDLVQSVDIAAFNKL